MGSKHMCKVKGLCIVRESVKLAPEIYSMWLEAPGIVEHAVPGQFVSLYCSDRDHLLPRPISICELDYERGLLRLVYRVVGEGTRQFSRLSAGDAVEVMGPLGNGFIECQSRYSAQSRCLLIGGGIGIPPMLELAKQLHGDVTAVLGYRDSNLFLKDEFEKYGTVVIATDDGSIGTKGTVIDAAAEHYKNTVPGQPFADVICACGPVPMLRGVKAFGAEREIPAYISMEERMACGVGACLGCVCQSVEKDSHSKVNNKRVCKDGPVFLSTHIEL